MSRPKQSNPTLNEIMGSTTPNTLKDLPSILGEKMPELPVSPVGKIRLLLALKNRFGAGFRNIPGIKNIISEFDRNVKMEQIIKRNRRR